MLKGKVKGVLRRVIISVSIVVCVVLASLPCYAWLYDGGSPGSGYSLNNGTTLLWAATLFVIDQDCYADNFGTALSRMNENTSFDIYLTSTLQNVVTSAIAHWTVAPTGPILQYYYFQPDNPIFLTGGNGYALVVMPHSTDSYGAIGTTYSGYLSYLSADQGTTWYKQSLPIAVRVDGTVVPEPCGIIILTIGLAGFSRRLRGK